MSRIEDMLRDPSNRPQVAPCEALTDRVVASIEGEPDPPPARGKMTGGLVMVAIVGVAATVAMWPQAAPPQESQFGDPRAIVENVPQKFVNPQMLTTVTREAQLLKGDAEAVIQPFKAKLSRM